MTNSSDNAPSPDEIEQEQQNAERMIGCDFVFSIIVLLFSIFVISDSLTMPFSGTVGGVTTTWYESPGLLPLFIGFCLFLTGLSVFWKSVKEDGRRLFQKHFADVNPIAFLLSGGGILTYIFVFITWFDFYLGSSVFLLFYISLYYLDDAALGRKLIGIYYSTILICALVFLTGLDAAINSAYEFTTDGLLILCAVALIAALISHGRQTGTEMRKKVRMVIIIAFLFPAILVPTFRYFLLVPMPKEGLVVEQVFNNTYYTYLAPAKEVEDGNLSDEQLEALDNAF